MEVAIKKPGSEYLSKKLKAKIDEVKEAYPRIISKAEPK